MILTVPISFIVFLFVATVITLVAVIVAVIRAKSKIHKELQLAKASALYDTIETPPSVIDSNRNVAYVSAMNYDT